MSTTRQPVLFIPHGGGPWPFVELPAFDRAEVDALAGFLRGLPTRLPTPRAVLVITAHWLAPRPTVGTAARPPMLFDYYGFPPESYRLSWPAPGDPALAAQVRGLLTQAGIDVDADDERGFDHGTFIPMMLMDPDASLPTVQLSLQQDLDPAMHLAIGRALAPLRDEGVLIVGSGMSYHDLRGFFTRSGGPASERFDAWLQQAATAAQAEREQALCDWERAPAARSAHPHEDHLLPLMVAAGAAGSDRGERIFDGRFGGARLAAFRYG